MPGRTSELPDNLVSSYFGVCIVYVTWYFLHYPVRVRAGSQSLPRRAVPVDCCGLSLINFRVSSDRRIFRLNTYIDSHSRFQNLSQVVP